jgi:hypothetical protein
LRGELICLWENASLPVRALRQRIFALWDNASDDEVGAEARSVIEAFVRETIPAGSPDGFGAEELRALNRTRRSTSPFAPYPS